MLKILQVEIHVKKNKLNGRTVKNALVEKNVVVEKVLLEMPHIFFVSHNGLGGQTYPFVM